MVSYLYLARQCTYILPDMHFVRVGEPQRFYAINADGSISNVSFISPVVDVIQPAEAITIPPLPSCDSPPLQCIPPQQNGISAVYIPNEDNSSLILLEIGGEILNVYNIMSPCVFNDFALLSNFNNKPLLIACRLADNDSSINYALVDRYGTSDNRVMRVPGTVTGVVSPITVAIPRLDEGGASHSIVSITSQNNIIVYETDNFDGDIIMTSSYFPPCAPVRIQRQQRFSNAFLLTCADGQLYLVNISIAPISFVSLPNSIMAIAHSAEYGLIIILSRSTATVTIQEILAQSAATRTSYTIEHHSDPWCRLWTR